MHVNILQHVPFEGPGSIGDWLAARGARVTTTDFWRDVRLTDPAAVDWLIIMGGPMSANDETTLPWLRGEKRFIAQAVERGKTVLGICLGAQLLAATAGARVFRNGEREIGWFAAERAANPDRHPLAGVLPPRFEPFHWHGETFELPVGAVHLASSAACAHQAFALADRVVGLQFHLETTADGVRAMLEHGQDDLASGPWVQPADEMLARPDRFSASAGLMTRVLDRLALPLV
jgi:GMP synthase-like glutamine amidotransferase